MNFDSVPLSLMEFKYGKKESHLCFTLIDKVWIKQITSLFNFQKPET